MAVFRQRLPEEAVLRLFFSVAFESLRAFGVRHGVQGFGGV